MRIIGFAALAVVLAVTSAVPASGPIGTYALIEKVVMQPSDDAPKRVQVWGVFTTIRQGDRLEYGAPVRGYLDFVAVRGKEDLCRNEWNDLKKAAGTTDCVAMGRYETPGRIRRPKLPAASSGAADAERVKQWIADLDSDQFAIRERATRQLEALGEAVAPALRKALDGKLSVEARKRIDTLLAKLDEAPDTYPLGMGLWRIKTDNQRFEPIRALLDLPAQVSPADGSLAAAGQVTLKAANIRDKQHKDAHYVFELQNGAGEKETSAAIAVSAKQPQWSPRMEVKPGEKYTWRVWAVEANWKGPMATADFRGKAAR